MSPILSLLPLAVRTEHCASSLAKLKVSYLKKYGPHAEFPQPRTYADPFPSISIARLRQSTSHSSGPIDLYVRGSRASARESTTRYMWPLSSRWRLSCLERY